MEAETEVLFNPFPKQIEFLEAVFGGQYTFIMYGGSIRGGKTFAGVGALLLLAKKYPKSKWVIVRTDLQTLKRNTLPSFWKCCPRSFVKTYNQETQTVTFTNGSQIIFFGENYADDKELNRWRGLECNGFLLEELNELQFKSFNKAIERAGSNVIPNKPKPLIIATCNPANNWVKEEIYNKHLSGTLPEKWLYITSKIFDNPYVSSDLDYMESLKTMPPLEYDLFVNGDWNSFAVNNPYAYCFDEKRHVFEGLEYNPELPLLLSFDFNIDPITCIAAQHYVYDETPELHIIKEFKLRNASSEALCDAIITEYSHLNPIYRVTGDGTGHSRSAISGNINHYYIIKSKLQLSSGQIKAPKRNLSPKNLRVLMNSLLQNYIVKIDSKCERLIKDLKYVEVDEFGDVKKDRSNENKNADLLDCFAYLNEMELKGFVRYGEGVNENNFEEEEY